MLLIIFFLKPIIDAFANSILKRRKGEFLLKPSINSGGGQSYLFAQPALSISQGVHHKRSRIANPSNRTSSRTKFLIKKGKVEQLVKLAKQGKFVPLDPPYQVSASLKLVHVGVIHKSDYYHAEHNMFPVGFKTIRTHNSMLQRNVKTEYTCEILDGGEKPIYKVTCAEDPANPIVRDSSTGCWIYVCNKINEIAEKKKAKVTISGTERFGLLDPIVVSLLESLPDAHSCKRYVFKSKRYKNDSFDD